MIFLAAQKFLQYGGHAQNDINMTNSTSNDQTSKNSSEYTDIKIDQSKLESIKKMFHEMEMKREMQTMTVIILQII